MNVSIIWPMKPAAIKFFDIDYLAPYFNIDYLSLRPLSVANIPIIMMPCRRLWILAPVVLFSQNGSKSGRKCR